MSVRSSALAPGKLLFGASLVIDRIAPFVNVKRVITADSPLPGQTAAAKPSDMAE